MVDDAGCVIRDGFGRGAVDFEPRGLEEVNSFLMKRNVDHSSEGKEEANDTVAVGARHELKEGGGEVF